MKKLIYGTLFLATVGITILACKKEILNNTSSYATYPNNDLSVNKDKLLGIPGTGFLDSILTSPLGIDITFGVKCKIARKIAIRPRDGQPCACADCFGLCNPEAEISVDVPLGIYDPNAGQGSNGTNVVVSVLKGNKAVIYLLHNEPKKEQEFGIDDDIYIILNTSGINAIKFKKGVYQYIDKAGTISDRKGNSLNYYGYVIADASVIL